MAPEDPPMLPLWPHQRRAVATFERYLNDSAATGSALVSMPTGTGKTAVIADIVSRVGTLTRDVIVLTPWKPLSRQLRDDLSGHQWTSLGLSPPPSTKVVAIPTASEWLDLLREQPAQRRVWVGTIAKVHAAWKMLGHDQEAMRAAFARIDFAVVDECHYEPSALWSRAIRGMGVKTCLLTATAFRNDNRSFDIGSDNHYRFPHHEAEAELFLRRPDFASLGSPGDPVAFVKALLDDLSARGISRDERILVRCDRHETVRQIVEALHARGETAIGFHHQFERSGNPDFQRAIPARRERPPQRFWVHQFKLREGFDDPDLRILALYDAFTDDRSTVQQIGRVLRNPSLSKPLPALVLAPDIAATHDAWRRYMNYDAKAASAPTTFETLASDLLRAQPHETYEDGRFRHGLDFESHDLWKEFAYAANVRVWRDEDRTDPDASAPLTSAGFDALVQSIVGEWQQAKRQVYGPFTPDGYDDARVIAWVAFRNSPVLMNASHIETRVGYTALIRHGGFVFYADSEGAAPHSLVSAFSRPEVGSLHRTLPEHARVTSVSLINSDLSRDAIRSRSLRARDLTNVASEIGSSTYAWTNALAVVHDDAPESPRVARYVGTKNSRIHDRQNGSDTSFESFYAWVSARASELNGTADAAPSLNRYASETSPPEDPTPVHVLLDIDPEWLATAVAPNTAAHLSDETGSAVDADGGFSISVGGSDIRASIAWDTRARRYRVSSPEFDDLTADLATEDDRGIIATINLTQSFRVATASGPVYSNGYFWDLADRRTGDDGILGILEGEQALASALDEKGKPNSTGRWPSDSVFGVIENILVPKTFTPRSTFLICTDLSAEIADFIAYDDDAVAFIHAKATKKTNKKTKISSGSELSAGAFHVVASQAIKNLRYLTLGNVDRPHTDYWGEEWKDSPHTAPRIRLPWGASTRTGAEVWQDIDRRVQSHSYRREVWVVAGASLSIAKLRAELQKDDPAPHATQAYVLLTSLWSAAQQCGIRLRVFCSP
ncbi:DEAD/DEAH box helicase family protein [Microbacterium oxydans]|uniref:DEAD/DEAH box helicase n=1 Tax=Microbacterium TaxID=33882 RepID=UPI00187D1363|nr:DEAD/DEAH box helicase family protein [Microbacterium sp. R1]MBE7955280.1 DEAD/DEAH box helicase family protein [Microbacterium sp. R1]